MIAAHRGLDEFAPENTAPAFIAALELGMAGEVDLRRTADGEIVIVHDDSLDRTTSGAGPVAQATLAEIKTFDAGRWRGERFAGERVPTLHDLLEIAVRHGRADITLVLELWGQYGGTYRIVTPNPRY
jgi:glycerophosphoryl diester phosphodiesterase